MAAPEIPWFRSLYDEILAYEGSSLYCDVLSRWIEKAQAAMFELARFKLDSALAPNDETSPSSMWNLYALNRVNDLLLLSFRENREQPPFLLLSVNEYEDFFSQLGFTIELPVVFSPFHHEIVQVDQSSVDEELIEVIQHHWPGLKFGSLQFSRSGVLVRGGKNQIVKKVAEHSTLYFTFRRMNRKTNDLSFGWGSNSQWRTAFRRDYQIGVKRIYNADGTNSLGSAASAAADGQGLTLEERVELCRNRCFIKCLKDDSDLWPYRDRFEEQCE